MVTSTSTENKIQTRAYEIYSLRGGVHGNDMDDWLQAEKEVNGGSTGKLRLGSSRKSTIKSKSRQ